MFVWLNENILLTFKPVHLVFRWLPFLDSSGVIFRTHSKTPKPNQEYNDDNKSWWLDLESIYFLFTRHITFYNKHTKLQVFVDHIASLRLVKLVIFVFLLLKWGTTNKALVFWLSLLERWRDKDIISRIVTFNN